MIVIRATRESFNRDGQIEDFCEKVLQLALNFIKVNPNQGFFVIFKIILNNRLFLIAL